MTVARVTRRLATAFVIGLTLTGCGSATPSPTGSAAALGGDITVYAAASLQGTFTELAASFEAANPGTTVVLNFAGSSALVTQIIEGAPADVFASADTDNMARLTDAALGDGEPVDFATNVLTIAVPPGNPAGITDLTDLTRPDVRLVACAPEVPCGAAAETVAASAGVTLSPVSEESSVTDVLGKVTSGEADAGLVYVTDVAAAGAAVEGIEFAEAASAVNTYPIVPVTGSASADVARAFVDYVTGSAGAAVLRAAGFGAA
ncbi:MULTISPECIES: molybdate ABC transporter substrate-binding protein [Cryobacterium]|uniref:molybdate ABC transporter substrate-binding protein n=1 Tax=Cryobacterium TaxID=69578 RepID=UPI000CD41AC2|nr:molybdate ABC transporter substrate-binding protein [Cryobacterium zongtaii]TFC42156.1 molybdate ABC transporter substrate-binding protein [Cryobacterium sp. TMN-39-2]